MASRKGKDAGARDSDSEVDLTSSSEESKVSESNEDDVSGQSDEEVKKT